MEGKDCCKCPTEVAANHGDQGPRPDVGCVSALAPHACGACARIKGHMTTRPPSCCPHRRIFPTMSPRVQLPSPRKPPPPPLEKKTRRKKSPETKRKRKKRGNRVFYHKTDHQLAKTKMSTIDIKLKGKKTQGYAPKSHT